MKKITIQQAQKLRTQGFNIVTNRKMSKVIRVSKDKLTQGKNEILFLSMTKVVITKQDKVKAWDTHCKINKI